MARFFNLKLYRCAIISFFYSSAVNFADTKGVYAFCTVHNWKCSLLWKDLHHKAVTNLGTGEVFKIYFWVLFCNFVDTVRDPEKGIEAKWNRICCCLEECSSSEILFSGRKSILCLAESHEDLFSTTARRHIWWTSESWFSSDCCYGNHTGKPQRQQSCDPILALALPSSFCNATRVRMLFPQKGMNTKMS